MNAQQHGTDSATRQRVGETAAAMTDRARASPTGVSAADTGHGVDAHMDRIASQSNGDPSHTRAAVEDHRRELQLAAIARAARAAQNKMKLPRAKRQVVGGGGFSLLAMLARPQARAGPAGQSALARDNGPRNTHGQRPHAANGREARAGGSREQNGHRAVGLRAMAAPRQKPIVPGGHPGVAVPPPRPRSGDDNYPGRTPERRPAGHAR